ncbi:hypothetical protein J3458_005558 [Metarhizium acridum]|uniref:uncharacterized protein n=1 Tax=Metarhizium acridum TaxID=92637 RepID=UPI001C6B3B61|nr:hypothetical protein J3458_005558 [Metarhizium acridum]
MERMVINVGDWVSTSVDTSSVRRMQNAGTSRGTLALPRTGGKRASRTTKTHHIGHNLFSTRRLCKRRLTRHFPSRTKAVKARHNKPPLLSQLKRGAGNC